jgi:hypothetical protein
MRKLVLLALATGALVMLQRRAARLGFVPALLLTAAAEKGLGMLDASPKAEAKPGLWRRLFPSKPVPDPDVEPKT